MGRATVLVSCALVLSSGCGDDETAADAGRDGSMVALDGGGMDAATVDKGRLRGRVVYADQPAGQAAVGQASVRINGKTYPSDSRGVFAADDLPEGELEVSVEDARLSRARVRIRVSQARLTQTELAVLPLKGIPVPSAEAGGEASDATDGVKVRLPAGSLRKKSSKEPAQGAAETRYALVKQGSELKAAPGRMRGSMDQREVELESFGMVDMRFYQGTEELELSAEAELDLPLGPNTFSDQQEVDAWSFDTESGLWKRENRATIHKSSGNGFARVKATHFSWWSIAQPIEGQTCVSGRLLTGADAGMPLADLWVQAVATSYWGSSAAVTDDQGSFCLNLKQGSTSSLSAFGVGGLSYFEWKQEITAGASAASCGGPVACTDLATITGESLFDECVGDVSDEQNHVLALSSGDPALDSALETALEGLGHTITIGVPYHRFDGTVDLAPYDAIYLMANYNWSSGDMPLAGQRQLINWVNCGGGLVTTEWTTWKIGSNTFQLIDAIFPAVRTTAYSSPAMETFVRVTPEATLNAGLPDSFTFMTTSFAGTESNLNPRFGAVIYYDSMTLDAGLIGWPYNLGRVASFSTTVGANEVADPNFIRLIANTLNWAQRD